MDAYLAKPIQAERLFAVIDRLLAQSTASATETQPEPDVEPARALATGSY